MFHDIRNVETCPATLSLMTTMLSFALAMHRCAKVARHRRRIFDTADECRLPFFPPCVI